MKLAIACALASLALLSCKKEVKYEPNERSIKYMVVNKAGVDSLRKFSGIVSAVNYSYLSFEDVSGKIQSVKMDIGDTVRQGQILAVLDKEKYELDVTSAEAEVKKAAAAVVKGKSDYTREQELFAKQASFQKQLDTYKYRYEAALSEQKSADAKLDMARRNLRNTELKAPYDGFISERLAEPKQEVVKGDRIFQIDAKGDIEVQFDIPEDIRKHLKLGMEGSVTFPSQKKDKTACVITFLGTSASKGNAFPVKARLTDPNANIKSGMSAEVSLTFSPEGRGDAFLLPTAAILPGKEPKTGFVFVYDPKTSTLRKAPVKLGGAAANLGIVLAGLDNGNIVATAGVSFLADKMKVNLYTPANQAFEEDGTR